MIATLSVWLNRQQQEVIDYLKEENRLLKAKLGGSKLHLTDAERSEFMASRAVLRTRIAWISPVAGSKSPGAGSMLRPGSDLALCIGHSKQRRTSVSCNVAIVIKPTFRIWPASHPDIRGACTPARRPLGELRCEDKRTS